MKDQILGQLKRLWTSFLSFTPGQKAVTIAAVLALSIGGWLFSSWASTPSYAPLFTNLAPADASAIIDKLNSNKTPYKLAANGTEVMVPQNQVYQLRLTMSSAGLPSAGSTGYSLLDKEGITTSEFKQQVDYQRALEGELDKTIQSINGVASAAVHLAIPQQSVFADGSQKTTGSVLLTTIPGTVLSTGQIQSVVNLVSSSVPGLTADQVSVSDSTGRVLSAAGAGVSGADTDSQSAATQAYEQTLQARAQAMLDKIVGVGNSIVTLNATLDFSKSNITSLTYASTSGVPPLSEATTGETYGNGAAANAGGPLGANSPSNNPNPSASASSSGGYVKTTDTRNNAVNQTSVTSQTAPGAVKNLSVSVVLDKKAAALLTTASATAQVSAAVGLDPKRGDTIAVTSAAFDQSQAKAASDAAAKAAKAAAAARSSAQMMSMAKTGGLILLILGIVVATFIANKRRRTDEPEDDLDLFLSTLRDDPGSLPPAPVDIVPPPSKEARMTAARQRQLAEMADTDPQEVARLLRGWLNAKES